MKRVHRFQIRPTMLHNLRTPPPFPQLTSGSLRAVVRACGEGQTHRHTQTDARDHYTLWFIKKWQYICDHNSGKS